MGLHLVLRLRGGMQIFVKTLTADPHCYCAGCCPEHWNRSTRHLFLPKPAWVALECILSFHLPPHRRRPLRWSKWCIPHIRTRNVVLHVALFTIVDFLKAFRVSYSDPGESNVVGSTHCGSWRVRRAECRQGVPTAVSALVVA